MLPNNDLGASLYRTWTPEQKREEIEKLVAGYRSGLPVGILCNMSELIAGNRKDARRHLCEMLTMQERTAAVEKETGGMQTLVREFFL